MPVYNAEQYLEEALESILNQTFTAYRFLIIDDGSVDGSEGIIKKIKDERVQYIKHASNQGLIATLNEGVELATGEYLIRMDADDVAHPVRFEKQIAFMDANLGIAISGTGFSVIGSDYTIKHPENAEECRIKLLQNTVLAHPSVIIRREAIIKNKLRFDDKALHAEDYKLWTDAAIADLKIANLPDILMKYRIHNGQISTLARKQQRQTAQQIKLAYAAYFFGRLLVGKSTLYLNLVDLCIKRFADLKSARRLVQQLKVENQEKKYFDKKVFNSFLDGLLIAAASNIYLNYADCNLSVLLQSVFDKHFYKVTNLAQKAKFMVRSFQKIFS